VEPPEAQPEHPVPDLRRFHGRSAPQGSGARAFPSRPPIAASFALEYRSAPSSVYISGHSPRAKTRVSAGFPRVSRLVFASRDARARCATEMRSRARRDRSRDALSARLRATGAITRNHLFRVSARRTTRARSRTLPEPKTHPPPPPRPASVARVLRSRSSTCSRGRRPRR